MKAVVYGVLAWNFNEILQYIKKNELNGNDVLREFNEVELNVKKNIYLALAMKLQP